MANQIEGLSLRFYIIQLLLGSIEYEYRIVSNRLQRIILKNTVLLGSTEY